MAADGTLGAARATDRTFVDVEVPELHPSPTNPRKLPTDEAARAAKVADIVATIRVDADGAPVIVDGKPRGIREPLCVRRRPAGGFEIIKGERRYRSAQITGLRVLTCEIVEMTDGQVLEEQLVEDGARVDLTPLEEAAALARLREEYSLDVAAIADRTGKAPRLVRQRLALHDALIADSKALLADGQISLGLALQLATLAPDAQREVVSLMRRQRDGGTEPLAAREIDHLLRSRRLRLVDGGFPLGDAELVPAAGACTTCPKRSGAQAALFADSIPDADLCGDKLCFEGKRKARAAQVTAAAKAAAILVVKGAEAKKYFSWGSRLSSTAGVVDLDARCDLVRPPAAPAPKNEGRHGGPQRCADEDAKDGKHSFGSHIRVREDDEDEPDDHDAAKAGCEAWVECDNGECEAWKEANPPPWHKSLPRGWKAPTWREALADQLPARPSAVVEDGDGIAHEVLDVKVATQGLLAAGVIDERQAKNEIRETAPAKKQGMEPYQIKQKAEEIATDQAREQLSEKAAKKKVDVGYWRLLVGLVLAGDMLPSPLLQEAATRRREEGAKKVETRPVEELRGWVAKQKDEGVARGLLVELLTGRSYGDESQLAIACRFFGVDMAALRKTATTKVKADAKAKEKKRAENAAKKKPKGDKAKTAPAKKDMRAELDDTDRERIDGLILALLANDPHHMLDIEESLEDDGGTPIDPSDVRVRLAALVKAGRVEGPDDDGVYFLHREQAPAEKPTRFSNVIGTPPPEMVQAFTEAFAERRAEICDFAIGYFAKVNGDNRAGFMNHLRAHFREAEWYASIGELLAGEAIAELHERGTITATTDRIERCDPSKVACPTCEEVGGTCDAYHRGVPPLADAHDFHPARIDAARKAAQPAPTPASAAETVQLEGAERKKAEAFPCTTCKAKPGKPCTSGKGKLGTGWFHVERTKAPAEPPGLVDERLLEHIVVSCKTARTSAQVEVATNGFFKVHHQASTASARKAATAEALEQLVKAERLTRDKGKFLAVKA